MRDLKLPALRIRGGRFTSPAATDTDNHHAAGLLLAALAALSHQQAESPCPA